MSKNKGNKRKSKTYVSSPINLDINKLENEFSRADIEMQNVDHSGPSYEGRVFLNNPSAGEDTELTEKNGYVGSYSIFGHGGCVGNLGHCDILPQKGPYDKRPAQDLKPQYKRIIITDFLKKIGKNTNQFTITIVPVLYGETKSSIEVNMKEIVKLDKIGIITYD